jgi:AAA family ATP:ADP antiporter
MTLLGFDVRADERRRLVSMAATLGVTIAAHTMLETARDALFLQKLPASHLTFVYVALALLALVLSRFGAWLSRALGRRSALALTLTKSAFIAALIALRPVTPTLLYVLYVATGVIATLTIMQFWLVAAEQFTVAQGKRLFGPLAAGGALGAVIGAGLASIILQFGKVTSIISVAAGLFWCASVIVAFAVPGEEAGERIPALKAGEIAPEETSVRSYSHLILALTAVSTAALLAVDYLFKSTAAARFSEVDLARFFAIFYAATNVVSLSVQLLLSPLIVRRLGVVTAILLCPLLFAGASAAVALTGAFATVVMLKAIDGGLRHSLHRVTSELLLLPVSKGERDKVKTLSDTVFSRGVQAGVAAALLGLSTLGYVSVPTLSIAIGCLALGWAVIAAMIRRPYLQVFRKALALGRLSREDGPATFNVASMESLMEAISSRDESTALAALDVIDGTKHPRLLPALVLLHPSEAVVLRALSLIATPDRTDWREHIAHLLTHGSVELRRAALRRAAAAGDTEPLRRGLIDPDESIRAAAAFFSAWDTSSPELHPEIRRVLEAAGEDGYTTRKHLLDVIAVHGDARHRGIVRSIAERDASKRAFKAHLAPAVQSTGETSLIDLLVTALGDRAARAPARAALVALGDPAFARLRQALLDEETPSAVRLHLPRTLMRFHRQDAVDFLSQRLESEPHGRVRFKILRALNHLSVEANKDPKLRLRFDVDIFEREALRNLTEHARMLSVSAALSIHDAPLKHPETPVERALLALVEDKVQQALERTFRCLGVAHRGEDIYGVFLALTRGDKRARANAGEFLDALSFSLSSLREGLRAALDDSDVVQRARLLKDALRLRDTPPSHDDAVKALMHDRDELLAAMATYHVLESGLVALIKEARGALSSRPQLGRLGAESALPQLAQGADL